MTGTDYMLEGATLIVLIAYALSLLIACLPWQRLGHGRNAEEAFRRLLLPLAGACMVVALGFSPHLWAWLGGGAEHPPLPLSESGLGALLHDLAFLVLGLWGGLVLWSVFQWGQALGRLRLLESIADPSRESGVRRRLAEAELAWPGPITVVEFASPVCFVYGVLKPRLMLSTAVLEHFSGSELQAIASHELAHVTRRDGLFRLVGQLALLAHLPVLGNRAFRRWALAAELACDEAASEQVGSRRQVAAALVKFGRLQADAAQTLPQGTMWTAAFEADGALDVRLRSLEAPLQPAASGPWLRYWPNAIFLVALSQLEGLHLLVESLLTLLHW